MKCEDCLIWNTRREDLIDIWERLPIAFASAGIKNEKLFGDELRSLKQRGDEFRLVRNTECPSGRCIL